MVRSIRIMADCDVRHALVVSTRRVSFVSGLYVRIRLILAPMLEVARHVPARGDIVDLGCGHGIFAQILHLYELDRRILASI